jgi:hypothetical protein
MMPAFNSGTNAFGFLRTTLASFGPGTIAVVSEIADGWIGPDR